MIKSKRGRTVLAAALIATLALSFNIQLVAAQDVKVYLDGQQVLYDVPPQIINSRTMVPLSLTIQQFTHEVPDWNDSTKTITFKSNGKTCVHTVGTKIMYIDDKAVEYDTPSLIIDSRTLVPIRMIADSTGASTTWDDPSKTVIITSAPKPTPVPTPAPTAAPQTTKAAIISMTPNINNPITLSRGETGQLSVVANNFTTRLKLINDTTAAETVIVTDYYVQGLNHVFTFKWAPTKLGERNPKVYPGDGNVFSTEYKVARLTVVTANVADITDAYPTASTVNNNTSVSVKIVTNTAVSKVWLNVPQEGDILHSTTGWITQGDKRVWTLTWKPKTTGHKVCYAYGSDDKGNKDYHQFVVDVTEVAPAHVSILDAYANASTVLPNDDVIITVVTTSNCKRVWAEYQDESVVTGSYSRADSSGRFTWTIRLRPYLVGRKSVYIYADDNSGVDIASTTMTFTVQQDPVETEPRIYDFQCSPNYDVVSGDYVTLTVITNAYADGVSVAAYQSNGISLRRNRTLANTNVEWVATTPIYDDGDGSETLIAYASSTYSSRGYDQASTYVRFTTPYLYTGYTGLYD